MDYDSFDFKVEYVNAIITLGKSCGAGLATIGLAGAGVGVGLAFGSLILAIGRNRLKKLSYLSTRCWALLQQRL
jgi:F0F1-type ATP synthase membrane subunit c/vacuolar-type H+-ATPase subunit K